MVFEFKFLPNFGVSFCCQQTSASLILHPRSGKNIDAKIFEEFAKEVLPRIKESGYNCILSSLRVIDGSEIP